MFQKFLNRNWFVAKHFKKSKGNLLFVDRARFYPVFVYSFVVSAISKKYKLDNIVLTDLRKNSQINKVYKALGFRKFIKSYNKSLIININTLILTLFNTLYAILKIKLNGFYWFINNFKLNQIPIGDLIYDLFIRFNNNFERTSPNLEFIKILFKSIFRFYIIYDEIEKKNIKFIFCSTENYSGNDGLSLRISMFKNIKNIHVFHDTRGNLRYINKIDKKSFYRGVVSNNRNILLKKKLKKFNFKKQKINNFLLRREKLKTKNTYTMISYNKANSFSNKNSNLFLKKVLDPKKKIILFACHAFSDASHSLGIDYAFCNYYEQLKKTLDFIKNNKNEKYLWIIKSHPNSFLNEREIIKNLINKTKNKNIILCPLNVKMNDLIDISEIVISGRGTVSLEATCKGKISINCGFNAYSDLGITYQANSKKKYFKYLKTLHKLQKPNANITFKARKILFLLENDLITDKKINLNLKNNKVNFIFSKNIEDKNFLSKKYFELFNDPNKVNQVINSIEKNL